MQLISIIMPTFSLIPKYLHLNLLSQTVKTFTLNIIISYSFSIVLPLAVASSSILSEWIKKINKYNFRTHGSIRGS